MYINIYLYIEAFPTLYLSWSPLALVYPGRGGGLGSGKNYDQERQKKNARVFFLSILPPGPVARPAPGSRPPSGGGRLAQPG